MILFVTRPLWIGTDNLGRGRGGKSPTDSCHFVPARCRDRNELSVLDPTPSVPTGVCHAVADGRRRIGRRSGPVCVGTAGLRRVVVDRARARAVGLPAAVLLLPIRQLPPVTGDRRPVRGRPAGRSTGGRVGARCPGATAARLAVHAGVPRQRPGGRRRQEPGGDAARRRGERPVRNRNGGTGRRPRSGDDGAARKRSGQHRPSGRGGTRVGRAAKAVQDRGHVGRAREQTQNGLLINAPPDLTCFDYFSYRIRIVE